MSAIASLFTLRGRTDRGGFWFAGLLQFAVGLAFALAAGPMADFDPMEVEVATLLPWIAVVAIPAWIGLAATVRRWHDRDKSGWWTLIGAVPVIGAVWIAVELGLLPGTPGANRFGPPPREAAGRDAGETSTAAAGRLDDVVARWTASAAGFAGQPSVSRPVARPAVISGSSPTGFGRRGRPR